MSIKFELVGYSIVCLAASGCMTGFSYPCLCEAFTGREPGISGEKSSLTGRIISGAVGIGMNLAGLGLDYIMIGRYFVG